MRRPASFLIVYVLTITAPGYAQGIEDRARAAAAAARTKTGESDTLLKSMITPGLSGQPIATINNSRSFTPSLACQMTQTLLELLVQPSASGDIGTVRISQDKDLDGKFDTVTTLGRPVSGICANGIISCQPGTWNQCDYLRWDVDAAKSIKLTRVELPELAGCYCVNNSCGTNLVWSNLNAVLSDLGGGMVGALTTADPRIGVAKAEINGPVLSYVGAQATACSASPDLSQTAYRNNPTAIQGDAVAQGQTSAVFQALAASPAGAGKAEQVRACTIQREVTVRSWDYDDIIGASGPFQSVTSCGADCRVYRVQGEGNCSIVPPTFTATFDVHEPSRLVSARIIGMGAEDWVQGRVNDAIIGSAGKRPWLTEALPSGNCAVDGTWANGDIHDLTQQFQAGSTSVSARVRGGKQERWGYVDVEVRVDTSCETSERLVDLCSGYGTDPACRLVSEDVDGVETFRSGVATGLRPLPQTRLFGSASCTLELSRDFFLRDRSYKCAIDTGSPAPPDLSRSAYIIDHSTETLLADRTQSEHGTITTTTRPFGLPDRGSVPACESICKTRTPKQNTAAAPAGVMASQQNDPAGFDTLYHVCSSDNVCPTGAGEEVISACGCLDDFPEAVVMMQAVRLGGADMTCTSATP